LDDVEREIQASVRGGRLDDAQAAAHGMFESLDARDRTVVATDIRPLP
jgi:hypothetical protein